MRLTLYILGVVFSNLGVLFLLTTITSNVSNTLVGYGMSVGFLFGGATILNAAISDYKGGLSFLFGTMMVSLSLALIGSSYNDYLQANSENLIVGLVCISTLLSVGFLLIWLGHRRHKHRPAIIADQAVVGESVDSLYSDTQPVLYPPMKIWRAYLLLLFSGAIYSVFLTYRIVKDLYDLGEKTLHPKRYAAQILIPFYGFVIFLRMAKSVAQLAKRKGIAFKIKPSALFWILVLTGVASAFMPVFLYPLTISIATIPWLILHDQMNCLRLAHATAWHQPADSYTWRQRSLALLGIPFLVLVCIGSKSELSYFLANRLDVGQTVTGRTSIYQLSIPDRQWREVASGTLYPDTNLELLNKSLKEWVVVRVLPNQQHTLDYFVDQRRTLIAANWKNFRVVETRSLNSGAYMTPISLATYSEDRGMIQTNQPLFVATAVTAEHVVEVIGQGSKNPESTAQALVKSFQLTAMDGKP